MIRLGVLGSTRGTNLTAIIDAIKHHQLAATIEIVISNKADALILSLAKLNNIPHSFIDATHLSQEAYDESLSDLLKKHQVQLIVLIGYMKILSKKFVNIWKNKIINVHPSLLPAFAGKMDLKVHEAVLAAGVAETGCSVHYVTEEVDAGPIILQKKCGVSPTDTPEILKRRVQRLEGEALVEAIKKCDAR